jgi:hypothetical protein
MVLLLQMYRQKNLKLVFDAQLIMIYQLGKKQQLDNESKFLNEMILHDEDSEEKNAPSFIDNNQSE